jgi:hypothetical protein
MSNCPPIVYSGLGDCDALFRRLTGFLVLDKKTAISNEKLLATWQAIIAGVASQTGIYLPITRGYQNNTAEPERTTANTGQTEKTGDPLVALVGFLQGSYCDYKTLYDWDGRQIDFVGVLDTGQLWITRSSAGATQGFRSNFTIRKNAPLADNVAEGTPLYVDFLYLTDMDNGDVSTPEFTTRELRDVVPVGLRATVTDPYDTGDVTILVTKRCSSDPQTDLTAVDNWEIISAGTQLDVDITAVDATSAAVGSYILTIKQNAGTTPIDLTQDVVLRAVKDDSSNLTYVSQKVNIPV